MALVRERLAAGDLDGARDAKALAAREYDEARQSKVLGLGFRVFLSLCPPFPRSFAHTTSTSTWCAHLLGPAPNILCRTIHLILTPLLSICFECACVTGVWQVELLSELDQEIANASMKFHADLIQRQALHAGSIALTGLCLSNPQNKCPNAHVFLVPLMLLV